MPATRSPADEPRPGDVLSLDLSLLDKNPFQPRTEMDMAKLEELKATIAREGLLQPISVRPMAPGRYYIVVGHRRVECFKQLLAEAKSDEERRKYALIRATVSAAVTDEQMARAAYVENAARDNLNPLDEAAALVNIRRLGGHATAAQVAEAVGQPERRVRRLLKLATAPQVVKDCVTAGLLVDVSEVGQPPKRARRTLDLIAALEFTRLYEHHAKNKPATADERTTTAMARALREDWGKRRVENYVEGIINGTSPAEPTTDTHPAVAAKNAPPKTDRGGADATAGQPRSQAATEGHGDNHEVCSSSSDRFTLYLSRLKVASLEQLEAAQTTVDDIRQLIAAQLQARSRAAS